MNITHLSTSDVKGGAAISAYRLHRGLLLAQQESSMLVLHKASQDETVVEFFPPTDLGSRIKRRFRRRAIVRDAKEYEGRKPSGYEVFSDERSPFGQSILPQIGPCDIVHLHWVASFLDYDSFFRVIPHEKPVVWTLHDMNPVTGGCHYDMECGRHQQGCHACPQLGSTHAKDLAAEIWARKLAIVSQVPLHRLCLVTPSRWLGRVAKGSRLFARFRVETIPYGIDLDAFAPRDPSVARDVLGIPRDAKVVLFVAEIVDNARKGYAQLMTALSRCSKELEGLWLLSVGHKGARGPEGMRGSHLSHIDNERFLSLVYSAADVFVIPSLQDNLPNTVLEALACGVPVVGFDVGGIPDMVREGETGRLVKRGDIDGLRRAIVELLQSLELRHGLSRKAREVAVEEYALRRQAEAYTDLYATLV